MAANVYRMLKEISVGNVPLDRIQNALSYTPMGELICFDEWSDIYNATTLSEALKVVDAILPKYNALWLLLGKPVTHDDWVKSRSYNYRTKLYKAYSKIYLTTVYHWEYLPNGTKNLVINSSGE
jgi:hypothetical protein